MSYDPPEGGDGVEPTDPSDNQQQTDSQTQAEAQPEQAEAPAQRPDAQGQQEQDPAPARIDLTPPTPEDKGRKSLPTVIVRYGLMLNLGQCRHSLEQIPIPGDKLVVRTDRGVELAEVVANVSDETSYGCVAKDDLDGFLKTSGEDFPFRRDGKVLRRANPQDVIDHKHLQGSAKDEGAFCRKQIEELGLEMKLISVEHLLGGERIIFNFASENRVDFRELVRRLAKEYRTRIEMRQVGARDEARLLADYERCGQRCCCQQFMKELKPVSMRMAKVQKATLDPSKISGRCGRLMCCLRFEDETYEDLRTKLPKKNTWVKTGRLYGRVLDTQILTQLVRVELADRTNTVIPVEEIVDRDIPEPTREQLVELAQKVAAEAKAPAPEESPWQAQAEPAGDGQQRQQAPQKVRATQDPQDKQPAKPKKKRRRGRRRQPAKKAPQPAGAGSSQQAPKAPETQAKSQGQSQQPAKPKRKRRRRRRKK